MSKPTHILQLTDLHLKADPNALLRGKPIKPALDAVLALATAHAHWPPDLIIVSGDIADDETPAGYRAAYRVLAERLRMLLGDQAANTEIAFLPGNHDDPQILEEICEQLGLQGCGALMLEDWQIILLDSTLPGTGDGALQAEQLAMLEALLAINTAPNILIALHHPLVGLDSAWMDSMRVKDADDFFAIVNRFNRQADEKVRGVIWGHAHQTTDMIQDDIRLLGTPAACPIQFTPASDEFAIDEERAPGLRWLTLSSDGSITTCVQRTDGSNE